MLELAQLLGQLGVFLTCMISASLQAPTMSTFSRTLPPKSTGSCARRGGARPDGLKPFD
jgi:hypothetical protein